MLFTDLSTFCLINKDYVKQSFRYKRKFENQVISFGKPDIFVTETKHHLFLIVLRPIQQFLIDF